MASTPLYALVYPTTANQITPLATHFSNLASSVESALASSTGRIIGTNSARTALAAPQLKEGLDYYTTDTKREWSYDGTNWISNDIGSYVIYPTSVNGGSIQTDGTINTSAVSSISFNGVFSSRFRKYRVEFAYNTTNNSGSAVRLRASGTDQTAADFYSYSTIINSTGTVVGQVGTATQHPVAGAVAAFHYGFVEFTNVATTGSPKYITAQDGGAPQTQLSLSSGWSSNDNGTYDGFSFILTGGGSFVTTNNVSRFKIYGYA